MTWTMERAADPTQGGAGSADARVLAGRIQALDRFVQAAEPYLTSPEERLRAVRSLVHRAGQRLALSGEHTVVALAGPTGCGKSSLFNALAGMALSPVGVRRPTTSQAFACVWGEPAAAAPVLEWLGVPPAHRFARESALDADDQVGMRGLVLVDLPDFDSIELAHSVEADRLLELVDLVVWVVDPQKYADRTIHKRQLHRFRRHGDVTLVALNQADLLRVDDLTVLLKDLRRLLADDGLADVPVVATSAVDVPAGLAELRAGLEQAVVRRQSALQRLAGDIDVVVEDLADLVGPPAGENTATRSVVRELADGLAGVAGVPALAEAVEASYRRRAVATMAWPLQRWLSRLRVEPVRGFGLTSASLPAAAPGTGSDPSVAQRVTAGLAARAVATRVAEGLPFPWPEAVATASRSRLYQLPDALTVAVDREADIRTDQVPLWWRVVAVGQYLLLGLAVLGLGWLLIGWILQLVALPVAQPRIGPVSVPTALFVGGLALGATIAALVRPVTGWAARVAAARVEHRLRSAITEVGREFVVAPVRVVLRAYGEAREALYAAAGLR